MDEDIIGFPVERFLDTLGTAGNTLVENFVTVANRHKASALPAKCCPVCESADAQPFVDEIIRLKNRQLYVKSGRPLLRCSRCGCIRASIDFSTEWRFEFLNGSYDVIPGSITPDSLLKAAMRMMMLSRVKPLTGITPRSLLEVSSYDGVTLKAFLQTFGGTVTGIEPTVKAVDFAETVVPELKGLMHRQTFEMHEFAPDDRYDAVIFSLSFQMISKPLESLRKLKPHLNPGAIVLMNEGGYINDVQVTGKRSFPFRFFFQQKTVYYTYQGLRYLMARAGYRYHASMRFDHPDMTTTFHAFSPDESAVPDEEDLVVSKAVSDGSAALFRTLASDEEEIRKYLAEVG